ncbi:TPA: hypothetical protein N0F65_005728 [Lagenidium giganteum]|uniref:VPS9 domain-containing protein n=1 Tax=Lagenidium giganteum TaxID=4803 RepID=A0AAV2Z8T4_9STRA|nr:TPA: hypothetical protein N0F65_005728 [Lagenidium giganteum]
MMFWTRSSSSSASNSATTAPSGSTTASTTASTSQSPSPSTENGQSSPFVLSDQRRQELLLAARANRASWVDGSDAMGATASRSPVSQTSALVRGLAVTSGGTAAACKASLSPSCQQALAATAKDLESFFSSLDALKELIIPSGDVESAVTPVAESAGSCHYTALQQELMTKRKEVDAWSHTHAVADRHAADTRHKHATKDQEMLFLLAFRELLTALKQPQASDFVYQIQSFVKQFDRWDLPKMLQQRALRDRPGGVIHAFIDKMVRQLHHHDRLATLLGRQADPSTLSVLRHEDVRSMDAGESMLHETLEAFVMEKLYAKALTPTRDSVVQDDQLHERIASLAFVDFQHLDLPRPADDDEIAQWDALIEQLRALPTYMSPRRKMDCVLRVCQDLTTVLAQRLPQGRFPSADEFLPGLIYLLLKANPPELKRNVNYILEYRHPKKLVSEPGYFFTHVVSSVAFLEQVNGSLLTITPEEFEEGLRSTKHKVAEQAAAKTAAAMGPEVDDPDTDDGVSSTVSGESGTHRSRHGNQDQEDGASIAMPSVLDVRERRVAVTRRLQPLNATTALARP